MKLSDVKAAGTAHRRGRRVGRGPGSGRGCTAGRGNNGQGSRSGAGGRLGREGGQMPLYRRLPKRGFTNADFRVTHDIVNVKDLAAAFPQGGEVDREAVKAARLVKKKASSLKVLGKGVLPKRKVIVTGPVGTSTPRAPERPVSAPSARA